jgi:hypothetical protein
MKSSIIIVALAALVATAAAFALHSNKLTGDCCLDGNCCHGVEYCCDTCDGSCRCSVGGKCHAEGSLQAPKQGAVAIPKNETVKAKDDCCLDGNCCHGVEYCCDTCDGSCRCSVGGKCHAEAPLHVAHPPKQGEIIVPRNETVKSKDDCCLDGNCCHGLEYCCDTCNGSCRCSVHGKC